MTKYKLVAVGQFPMVMAACIAFRDCMTGKNTSIIATDNIAGWVEALQFNEVEEMIIAPAGDNDIIASIVVPVTAAKHALSISMLESAYKSALEKMLKENCLKIAKLYKAQ